MLRPPEQQGRGGEGRACMDCACLFRLAQSYSPTVRRLRPLVPRIYEVAIQGDLVGRRGGRHPAGTPPRGKCFPRPEYRYPQPSEGTEKEARGDIKVGYGEIQGTVKVIWTRSAGGYQRSRRAIRR